MKMWPGATTPDLCLEKQAMTATTHQQETVSTSFANAARSICAIVSHHRDTQYPVTTIEQEEQVQ